MHKFLTGLFCLLAWPMAWAESIESFGSAQDLIAAHPEMLSRPLSIVVEGKTLKSNYGGLKCVYCESAVLYFEDEEKAVQNGWSELGPQTASEDIFHIVIGDRMRLSVEPTSTLRLFVSPAFQRDFKRHASTKDQPSQGRQVDYCLQMGKKYHMVIHKEVIEYGPPKPDGRRETNTYYFLKISDKEFKNGQPQVDPTPQYRAWIYGFLRRNISITNPMTAKSQAMVKPAQSVDLPCRRGMSLTMPKVVPPTRQVIMMAKNRICRNVA